MVHQDRKPCLSDEGMIDMSGRSAGEAEEGPDSALTPEELAFFDAKPASLPLYEAFRDAVLASAPGMRIEVRKTQISFFLRRMFAAVSFTPVRHAKDRPDPYLTITFGLPYQKESDRIDVAIEPYPNRWTHHVMIGDAAEVDSELLTWIEEAAAFAERR